MPASLSIGFVARRSGCSVPTIRYYEEIGLLPPAARSESGQRHFDTATLQRLAFVRRCREFGFSIEQVRALIGLIDDPQHPCGDLRTAAATHLVEVRRKRVELQALEASLDALVAGCDAGCADGAMVDCCIVEGLHRPPGGAPGCAA